MKYFVVIAALHSVVSEVWFYGSMVQKMTNKIEEDYQNVLSTHERIMSLLKNESLELKKIPHRLANSERTPHFDAFERFTFEKGEITPLVQSVCLWYIAFFEFPSKLNNPNRRLIINGIQDHLRIYCWKKLK